MFRNSLTPFLNKRGKDDGAIQISLSISYSLGPAASPVSSGGEESRGDREGEIKKRSNRGKFIHGEQSNQL